MAYLDPEMRGREGSNVYEVHGDREKIVGAIYGGSVAEAVIGAVAVVLAILGLGDMYPKNMAAIATIAVSVALLFQGAAIASRSFYLAEMAKAREVVSGFSGEIVGGAIGLILGILALFDYNPGLLIPVAIIVLGCTLVFGGTTVFRLGAITSASMTERTRRVTRKFVDAAFGAEVLVGIAAIVLAILALLDKSPTTMILVSLLVLGAAVLVGGSAVAGRLSGVVKHELPPKERTL